MKLLAFETSSQQASIALLAGDVITEELIHGPRQQAVELLPLTQKILQKRKIKIQDLDGIAFGRGPGSFTGLRLASAVSQGLSLASDIPLLPVSSLAATAQGLWRLSKVVNTVVCVDAYMGEVFWGLFSINNGIAHVFDEEYLSDPGTVSSKDFKTWSAVGNGFLSYKVELESLIAASASVHTDIFPSARDLLPRAVVDLETGYGLQPEDATPIYLRSEKAWLSN